MPDQTTDTAGEIQQPAYGTPLRNLRARLNGLFGALCGQGNELADEMRAAVTYLDEHVTPLLADRDAEIEQGWAPAFGGSITLTPAPKDPQTACPHCGCKPEDIGVGCGCPRLAPAKEPRHTITPRHPSTEEPGRETRP